jgi:hypothetical protein
LTQQINSCCKEAGFPLGEEFKWSPSRDHWMRTNLTDQRRHDFFFSILQFADLCYVEAIVAVVDINGPLAKHVSSEHDLATFVLERIDSKLRDEDTHGIIIADRPGGDRPNENEFIDDWQAILQNGTDFYDLVNIALPPLCTDSTFSRLLQLADLIVSCTTQYLAGENIYSPPIFRKIRSLFYRRQDRFPGYGLKIWPDNNMVLWNAANSEGS